MGQNTFCRREKKLLLPASSLSPLRDQLFSHMEADPNNCDGKPYSICNLYFDDDSDSVIRNSIEKPFFKEKLRMRSYGTPTEQSSVFLEIKRKCDRVGTKRRVTMLLRDANRYLDTGEKPSYLSPVEQQVLREIDFYRSSHPVYPKVYIGYLRYAYYDRTDHGFRVTFDTDIMTRRHDLSLESGCYGTPLLPPEMILMEVKFLGAVPRWFASFMSRNHLYFGSYSKYGREFIQHSSQIHSTSSVATAKGDSSL